MKKIILIFLLIELSFCATIYNWRLDIKDQEGKNKIELIPGKFTKIYFELTNATDLDFPFLDEDSYKLSFDDQNIISLDEEIILTPKENLVYSTYIGLNCENSITENTYTIKINVSPNNDETDDESIEYNNIIVSINRKELEINLDILLYSMPKGSFNLFQLKKELYNVDEIRIKPTEIEGFGFEDIVIKSFNEREQLYEKNDANHGIIFDSTFGLKNPEETLKDKSFSLEIKLSENKLNQCYKLSKEEFEFSIEGEIPKIDEPLKKLIKFSFEDITEKYDNTTNFKIKTIIPVVPIMLSCSLDKKLLVPEEEDAQNNSYSLYKNIITKSENFHIEISNLEFNSEYFAYCEFSDTNYEDNKRQKINITIGNRENFDIFHQLKTTRESKRIPQCIKLTFDKEKISKFKEVGSSICRYFMKKEEPFIVRDLPTIICEIVEADEENATVCVSPSPKYNLEEYLNNNKDYEFNNSFNNFIEYIKEKYSASISEDIEYDLILRNPISIINTKYNITLGTMRITLTVSSNHTQKIQCFYKEDLSNNINNTIDFLDESSVILNSNEPNQIEVFLNSEFDDKIYSLFFRCYNLPNFIHKYESTNYIPIFTYLNDWRYTINDNKDSNKNNNISINCNEKKNKINPLCLIHEKISLNKIIKTVLPDFLRETEYGQLQFSLLTEEAKFEYLSVLIQNYPQMTTFEPEVVKEFFKKSSELLKDLSSIDCSHYFYKKLDNETEIKEAEEKYANCRSRKKEGLEKIIPALEDMVSFGTNINFILQKIGRDLEENLKYILIFLKELTNNDDSYENGWSSSVTNFANMIQEQFYEYWPTVYNFLIEEGNYQIYIDEFKKEVLISIFEILTNIPRIIHYNEIDGYLDNEKKSMTKTGLIINDTSTKAQNAIIECSKKMNEFDLSSNFNGYFKNILVSSEEEKKILEISKDISLEIDSKFLLSTKNANSMQIFIFDSPLVTLYPQENSDNTSNTLNNFISITILDKYGEVISLKDIDEKNRPKILYAKDKYENLKGCYYYDEKEEILKTDGMILDDNYEYEGKKYYKCETSHLTMFTAGTNKIDNDGRPRDDDDHKEEEDDEHKEEEEDNEHDEEEDENKKEEEEEEHKEEDDDNGLKSWHIILIVFGVLLLLALIIGIFLYCRKKKISSDNIDANFTKNEGLMREDVN